jgi:hypothetical protein
VANIQITLDADADGINPAWTVLRSEEENDAAGQKILANALSRRFATNPGTYFTDPDHGLNLEDLIGKGITADSLGTLELAMKSQAEEDERVLQAEAKVFSVTGLGTPDAMVKVRLSVVPRTGEPFQMTFTLTSDKVSLLKGKS